MWEKQWLPRQEKVLPSVKFQWKWVGRDFSGKCWRDGESAVYMETRTNCVGESEFWTQITLFKSLFCYLVHEWPWALHLTFYFFSCCLNRDNNNNNTQHFRSVLENIVSRETCSLFILQYIVFPWNLYNHYNKFNSYSNKRSVTFFGGSSGGLESKGGVENWMKWRGPGIAGDDDIEERWPGGLILQPLVDGKSDKWSCVSGLNHLLRRVVTGSDG